MKGCDQNTLPSLGIDGHRPCVGRDGRDPSVEVAGDLVAEHRPKGVADPVQPTLVNAEELCQCCCFSVSTLNQLTTLHCGASTQS